MQMVYSIHTLQHEEGVGHASEPGVDVGFIVWDVGQGRS